LITEGSQEKTHRRKGKGKRGRFCEMATGELLVDKRKEGNGEPEERQNLRKKSPQGFLVSITHCAEFPNSEISLGGKESKRKRIASWGSKKQTSFRKKSRGEKIGNKSNHREKDLDQKKKRGDGFRPASREYLWGSDGKTAPVAGGGGGVHSLTWENVTTKGNQKCLTATLKLGGNGKCTRRGRGNLISGQSLASVL